MTIVAGAPPAHAASTVRQVPERFPYLPGLDAVRALAVSAVLLFHLPSRLLPGGFLGVDVFFVLSGFLITSLLLVEVERQGSVDFRQFYLRRARRLLPALLLVLTASTVLVLTLATDAAAAFRHDLLSALTYTTNWWYVVDGRTYFEAMGRPPLLQHLWSLALEEQFYLMWPAVLVASWRWRGRRGVGMVALMGAAVSSLWMALLATAGGEDTIASHARLYFGSDTHAMPVLLGAALATVWRPSRLPRVIPTSGQRAMELVGWGSIMALVAIFLGVGEDTAWLYHGGFLAVGTVAVALTAAASHPGAVFGARLAGPGVRWLGTRSYGIYLWHWPIFLVTRPDLDLPYGGWLAAATSLALTGVAAEASYRWVEVPVRRGRLGEVWRRARSAEGLVPAKWAVWGTVAAALLLVSGRALVVAPAVSAADYLGGVTSMGAGELGVSALPVVGKPDIDPTVRIEGRVRAEAGRQPLAGALHVTAVGDSVLLGARGEVRSALPHVTIDAAVSRQPDEAINRVRERLRADALGAGLVLQTGTNGIPSYEDLRRLLGQLGELDRVVVVNVRSPVPWMEQSNAVLARATSGLDNVVLVDWARLSEGHREYFVADGTHLTSRGAAAYAGAIDEAITSPRVGES